MEYCWSAVTHCPGCRAVWGPEETRATVQHACARQRSTLGLYQHTQTEVHPTGLLVLYMSLVTKLQVQTYCKQLFEPLLVLGGYRWCLLPQLLCSGGNRWNAGFKRFEWLQPQNNSNGMTHRCEIFRAGRTFHFVNWYLGEKKMITLEMMTC